MTKILSLLLFFFVSVSFVLFWQSRIESKRYQKSLDSYRLIIDNSHIFCKDCCWKNEFGGRVMFTCCKTEEELWERIP